MLADGATSGGWRAAPRGLAARRRRSSCSASYAARVIGPKVVPAGRRRRSPGAVALVRARASCCCGWRPTGRCTTSASSTSTRPHGPAHRCSPSWSPPLILLATPEWLARLVVGRGRVDAHRAPAGPAGPRRASPSTAWRSCRTGRSSSTRASSNGLFHYGVHTALVVDRAADVDPGVRPVPRAAHLAAGADGVPVRRVDRPDGARRLAHVRRGRRVLRLRHPDRLWGLSVTSDQQVAGLFMKLGAGIYLWVLITCIFFRWARTGTRTAERRAADARRATSRSRCATTSPATSSSELTAAPPRRTRRLTPSGRAGRRRAARRRPRRRARPRPGRRPRRRRRACRASPRRARPPAGARRPPAARSGSSSSGITMPAEQEQHEVEAVGGGQGDERLQRARPGSSAEPGERRRAEHARATTNAGSDATGPSRAASASGHSTATCTASTARMASVLAASRRGPAERAWRPSRLSTPYWRSKPVPIAEVHHRRGQHGQREHAGGEEVDRLAARWAARRRWRRTRAAAPGCRA